MMISHTVIKKLQWCFLLFFSLTLTSCYTEDDEQFVAKAGGGDFDGVKNIVKNVRDINVNAYDGWTALTNSACRGHRDIVIFLLDNGADVNKEGAGNHTPIYWAAFSGHLDIVKLLVERGANITLKCIDCYTPIKIAEIRGNKDIVNFLLEYSRPHNAVRRNRR